MICENCKHQISESAKFCENCGTKVTISSENMRATFPSLVMNTDNSLRWSRQLMKLGLISLPSDHRSLINHLSLKNVPPDFPLGQVNDEIEIGFFSIAAPESRWQIIAKAVVTEQANVKLEAVSAYKANGERLFNCIKGGFVVTNIRMLTYSTDNNWCVQTNASRLYSVEIQGNDVYAILKLILDNRNYYELHFSLPKVSLLRAFAIMSDDSVISEASKRNVEVKQGRANSIKSVLLSFFNELCFGARQLVK